MTRMTASYHLRWLDAGTGRWRSKGVGTDRKRAEREAEDSGGGGLGALLGMLGSVVLSPFTAGASLAWLPATTAAGGAIGTAVDPPGGPAGARRNQAYQTAASVASPFVGATAAGFMNPNPSPHNMPNPTFWDSFSSQLESYGVLGDTEVYNWSPGAKRAQTSPFGGG